MNFPTVFRNKYDALTESQKSYVSEEALETLTAAEAKIAELEKQEKPDDFEEENWWDKTFGKVFDKIFGNWWGNDDDDSDDSTQTPGGSTEENQPGEDDSTEEEQPGGDDSTDDKEESGSWFNKLFGCLSNLFFGWWK